ncbi:hypothetical protein ARMSODRAFT_168956 [Armillaria solidipes]|uniref:Terpenoid synthase n=1 Tax=Armillaria solidipes TaxID=1076256 RepID=A0A2H3BU69_9AGAR|nr:hypothetical protein ARMSODRAFT_168956 [Armillaria solidipes]
MEYFVVKESASAYGKPLDVYEHVWHDMLGLIPWYTHPKLLRILLSYRDFCEYNSSLDSSCQALVADILQEIHDSRSDTVHFTVDIRKQCKVLGPKIEAEIFILQTLMEKRYRLFNPEKVHRIVEPLNMYSMALYFESGILIPLALLFDTSGKYAMAAVLLMLFCARIC